eukprot:CAMPEP_0115347636 /NCGR_PEP_ID=MMETSP0270-20121206/94987_1 /TAXON_ID=71861 /ORGANISM="Scrippsiella trochoidea, Strain CCMP3099" /LENGTH=225 /DNA_ID=CAMNT_0002769573 /DNA_START=127 /DNA_END=804 /DNA_ORIENTATION=-
MCNWRVTADCHCTLCLVENLRAEEKQALGDTVRLWRLVSQREVPELLEALQGITVRPHVHCQRVLESSADTFTHPFQEPPHVRAWGVTEARQSVVTVTFPDEVHEVLDARWGDAFHKAARARGFDLVRAEVLKYLSQNLFRVVLALIATPIIPQEIVENHTFFQLRIMLVHVQHDTTECQRVCRISAFQKPGTLLIGRLAIFDVFPIISLAKSLQNTVNLLCFSR